MTIVSSHKLPDTIEAIYKAFFVDLNPIHKDNGFQSIFRELLREEGTEVLTKVFSMPLTGKTKQAKLTQNPRAQPMR